MTTEDGRCRLCEGSSVRGWLTVRGCEVDRCTDCDFVQVRREPSAAELTDLYSSSYFSHGKYFDEANQRRENERRLGLLRGTRLPLGSRILDAGCATGDFVAYVQPHYDVWGLDISAPAIELAKRKNPALSSKLRAGRIEDQDFEPESFDAIMLWDVLEHLWQPKQVCNGLFNLLRPGGYLLLSTPDISAPIARIMRSRWAFMTPPEHLCFFGRKTMERLLQNTLQGADVDIVSRGKWVNMAFLMYKARRVFPLIPQGVVDAISGSSIGGLPLYVPTMDIQYAQVRKQISSNQVKK